jgi:hypothetical protein
MNNQERLGGLIPTYDQETTALRVQGQDVTTDHLGSISAQSPPMRDASTSQTVISARFARGTGINKLGRK